MTVTDSARSAEIAKSDEPDHYGDLGAVRRAAFGLIGRGVRDRRSAFHTPLLVTAGIDGFPAARTVVLRGFNAADRTLTFHTDQRARKVAELGADSRVAVVFYDAKQKIQVRVAGTATVHMDDHVSQAAWERLPAFSRRCYLGAPPGTISPEPTSGLPSHLELSAPGLEEADPAVDNFAVINVAICRLEWLYLSSKGHRRATLRWDEAASENADWLMP